MATFIPLTDVRDARAQLVRRAVAAPMTPGPVVDTRSRPLADLRISVTDRCNFRCVYCMPKDVFGRDYPFLPHDALLTFEEITRVAGAFVALGVRKLRLTGGEPLLRRKVERLIEMLRALSDDLDITLTTNGALLARKARDLRAAGLSRVTVSLDSLDDATFRAMNDVDFPVDKVLEGIDAAAQAGLAPLKINVVVKRGMNEDSIVPIARRFRGSGHIVRFIEYMDVGATNGWRMDDVVPASEIVGRIAADTPIVPADPNYRGEVAERWAYADGSGEIGVIASVTQAFCRDCTRARLSTEGRLYTCLFANEGFDLREVLRGGGDGRGEGPPRAANCAPSGGSEPSAAASVGVVDDALKRAVAAIWRQRGDRYSEIRTANTARSSKVEMSYIGG